MGQSTRPSKIILGFLLISLALATSPGYSQHEPAILDVPDSPAQPGFDNADETPIYIGHFDDEQAGGFPRGLRSRLWTRHQPLKDPFLVRAIRDDSHVLDLNGMYYTVLDVPFEQRLRHGELRISFDLLLPAKPGAHPRSDVYLSCKAEPVDVGWDAPREFGPYLSIDCHSPALYCVAWNREKKLLVEFERTRWYRTSLRVDLARKEYDVSVDDKIVGEDIPFRDQRWFQGADVLTLSGGRVLLDNISVIHAPDKGIEPHPPPPGTDRIPVIPAPRLTGPPVLDGRPDDPVWRQAHLSQGLVTARGLSVHPEAKTWIGYHGNHLHIAVRARTSGRSGELEIQLDPSGGRYDHYVWFRVDHQGEKSQGFSAGNWPGGNWEVATSREKGFWTAECSIPLSACVKAQPSGSAWGVNVLLRSKDAGPAMLSANWGEPAETRRFAPLTGLHRYNTWPVRCRLSLPEPLLVGQAELSLSLRPSESVADEGAVASVTVHGPDSKSAVHELPLGTIEPGDEKTHRLTVPIERSGGHMFQVAIWPAGIAGNQRHATNQLGGDGARFGVARVPGSLELETDRNYYTNEERIRVRGTVVARALDAGTVAILELRSGEATIQRRQAVSSSPFILELPLEQVPPGESLLSLRLLSSDDTELASAQAPLVRRVARKGEVKIRWDRTVLIDGEPFFPLFIWSGDATKAQALGCNTVFFTSYSTPPDRDAYTRKTANHLGLKALFWPAHPNINPKKAAGRMARYMEDGASVLGWMPEEEPRPLPKTQPVADLEAMIREADPYHPTYITWVASWGMVYPDGMHDCDVAGVQAYPSYWNYDARGTHTGTKMIRAAVGDARPIWMTLQAFHYKETRVHPTPTEFRHMVWSAVAAGANGIGFWGCDFRNGFAGEDIRGLLSNKPIWEEAVNVIRAVRRFSPVIMSDELVLSEVTGDNENVEVVTRRDGGTLYVLVLNMRAGPEQVSLDLLRGAGRLVNELRPGGSWQVSNGTCQIRLDALQPLMLRFETTP